MASQQSNRCVLGRRRHTSSLMLYANANPLHTSFSPVLCEQGGMGCSAGVIALGLAQDLLQAHPGSLALVISHENICNATYTGEGIDVGCGTTRCSVIQV